MGSVVVGPDRSRSLMGMGAGARWWGRGWPDRSKQADWGGGGQGNVREKQNFLQVREKSGNFEKCQGILVI